MRYLFLIEPDTKDRRIRANKKKNKSSEFRFVKHTIPIELAFGSCDKQINKVTTSIRFYNVINSHQLYIKILIYLVRRKCLMLFLGVYRPLSRHFDISWYLVVSQYFAASRSHGLSRSLAASFGHFPPPLYPISCSHRSIAIKSVRSIEPREPIFYLFLLIYSHTLN